MFNTLAGVTVHLIKDNQTGTQGNITILSYESTEAEFKSLSSE